MFFQCFVHFLLHPKQALLYEGGEFRRCHPSRCRLCQIPVFRPDFHHRTLEEKLNRNGLKNGLQTPLFLSRPPCILEFLPTPGIFLSQVCHPLKQSLKQGSRALTLLVQATHELLPSWGILTMPEVTSFAKRHTSRGRITNSSMPAVAIILYKPSLSVIKPPKPLLDAKATCSRNLSNIEQVGFPT